MHAFLDPITQRLKCFGHVETNEPGDIVLEVPEGFYYDLRKEWIYNGKSFAEALPRPKEINPEVDTILKDPLVPDSIKAYFTKYVGAANVDRPA